SEVAGKVGNAGPVVAGPKAREDSSEGGSLLLAEARDDASLVLLPGRAGYAWGGREAVAEEVRPTEFRDDLLGRQVAHEWRVLLRDDLDVEELLAPFGKSFRDLLNTPGNLTKLLLQVVGPTTPGESPKGVDEVPEAKHRRLLELLDACREGRHPAPVA